jgi:RNA polymerase sigma factor (sigma-70 family)
VRREANVDPRDRRARDPTEQQDRRSRVADDVDVPNLAGVEAGRVSRFTAADANDVVVAAFEAHRDEIFTFVVRSTRDRGEAEDVVQETFLRLAREVRAGRTPEQLRAWLYRVAGNLVTSRFRHLTVARRWLEGTATRDQPPETHRSPEMQYVSRERFHQMEQALETVSRDARAALLLAAQGFSGREIARTLGRSELATRAMMSRARVRVRAALEAAES